MRTSRGPRASGDSPTAGPRRPVPVSGANCSPTSSTRAPQHGQGEWIILKSSSSARRRSRRSPRRTRASGPGGVPAVMGWLKSSLRLRSEATAVLRRVLETVALASKRCAGPGLKKPRRLKKPQKPRAPCARPRPSALRSGGRRAYRSASASASAASEAGHAGRRRVGSAQPRGRVALIAAANAARPPATAHPPRPRPLLRVRLGRLRAIGPDRTETGSPRRRRRCGGSCRACSRAVFFFFFFLALTDVWYLLFGFRNDGQRIDRSQSTQTSARSRVRRERVRRRRARRRGLPRALGRLGPGQPADVRFLTRALRLDIEKLLSRWCSSWIAVRVSFAPSYLLHARQVHGFRHRELARGGHRPAFRLRCRRRRRTRGQRAPAKPTRKISIGIVGGSRDERRRVARAAVTSTTASPSTRSLRAIDHSSEHTRHLHLCPCHP